VAGRSSGLIIFVVLLKMDEPLSLLGSRRCSDLEKKTGNSLARSVEGCSR
jgi:hypothetical protein